MTALRVTGYKEFMKAISQAPKDVKREVRTAFRLVGEEVRGDSASLFSGYGTGANRASHADSARGYRVAVRQRGVAVESSRRKTTGLHPGYGSAQMRHGLIPGTRMNERFTKQRMEAAMRTVARIFERRTL